MKKRVTRLLLAVCVIFAAGLALPAAAFGLTVKGLGNTADAQTAGLSLRNPVLQDKYSDKVKETEKKRNELRDRKNALEKETNQLQREADDILEYLKVIDEKQSETMLQMEAAQAELDRVTEEYNQATVELAEAEQALADQYEAMKKRIRYIYENGQMEQLEMYLESKSIADILNASEYIQRINEYDHNLLVNYVHMKDDVADRKQILGVQKESMEVATEMYRIDAEYCEQIISAKQEALGKYEEKIGAYQELLEEYIEDLATAQKSYEQAVAAQKAYIAEQERIRKQKEEEARRKAMEQAAKSTPVTSYNNAKDVPQTEETNINNMIWPLPGDYRTASLFGPRTPPCPGASSFHSGWDIGGKLGAEIVAALAGKVTAAGYNSSCGNHVYIDHGNGYSTRYLHLSAIKVSVGQHVKQGQVIGLCGSTGISTAPHLHFTLAKNGSPIDPAPYLKKFK
ncbi:MAG: peptidoglycan DD-metalloendopeptidase family protein [Lachnospiraceae bacterium]|nr:peptidoglycan DD-metalloendopeptidase family protein [Lachnospiraceae bacterium]